MKNPLLTFIHIFILSATIPFVSAKSVLQNLPVTGSTYDLHYHRLELTIDPAVKYITGCVTSHFKLKAGSEELTFDLKNTLQVDSVIYHGVRQPYAHTANLLRIQIPQTNMVNQDSVKVYYQGIPSSGLRFGYQEYWDDASFQYYTDTTRPLAFSDSEPYDSHHWWPCKQSLTDKIDSIDLIITTPSSYKVAANGILKSETDQGTLKTYHWKHRYPIATYLIACAVSDYVVYTDHVPLRNDRSVPMINYVFPAKEQEAKDSTAKLIAAFQLLDSLLGPYPFEKEKFGHAQAPTGMENQTMSFVGAFPMRLLTHELAHQWFGDKVTCGSWHDLWLNEGFATYIPMVIQEAGIETGISTLALRTQLIQMFVPYNPVSVYKSDTSYFGGSGPYFKGAMVLHMLRRQIGTAAFFQGLRNYLNDPALSYGFGTIEKLQQHLEGTSGQSLNNFFSEWYYANGFPVCDIHWNLADDHTIFLYAPQVQQTDIPFYHDLPLPLTFYNADKSQSFDTTLYLIRDHEYVSFNVGFRAETMEVDREKNVLQEYFSRVDPALQLASVTINCTVQSPTTRHRIPVVVTFTETMTGFDADDLLLSGASIQNFQGSGTTYTFELIPLATGELSVTLPGNTATSINGNKNATASFRIQYTEEVTATTKHTGRSRLKVYPVPASSSVTLIADDERIIGYSLTDMIGQQVQTRQCDENILHIDLSELNTGTYVLMVWNSAHETYKQLLIKK